MWLLPHFTCVHAHTRDVYIVGEYSKNLDKMVYPHHRSFLPSTDLLHSDRHNFPHERDPVIYTTSLLSMLLTRNMLKLLLKKTKIILQENSAVKGSMHYRILSTPVEPMHVVKDVTEHIVWLLPGVTDTKKVRTEEKARKRFRNSWLASPENTALSSAPFSFSKEELCIANSRAKSIRVPSSFHWRPSDLFTSWGMKSHEWKEVVCSGVIKYCIRGLLGENQRVTLYKFCDLMSRLFCHQFTTFEESVVADTHIILSLIERDFPVSLNSMVLHMLHHLPYYL